MSTANDSRAAGSPDQGSSASRNANGTATQALIVTSRGAPTTSLWGDAWRRLKRNRAAVGSLIFLLVLIAAAIAAPLLTPYSPFKPDFDLALVPPSPEHPLGTDELGRDLIARLIYGARVSLGVGLIVQTISIVLGTLIGLVSGYFGGLVDGILMRFVDIMYAFPNFLFAVFR